MATESQLEANKALVRKFLELLNVDRKIDEAIDTYLTPGFIEHDAGSGTGAEAMRVFFKQFFKNFPKACTDVKHMIAEGDLVVVHFHGRMRPQDRGVAVIEIFRVENGRLAEHWQTMQEVPGKSLNDNGIF